MTPMSFFPLVRTFFINETALWQHWTVFSLLEKEGWMRRRRRRGGSSAKLFSRTDQPGAPGMKTASLLLTSPVTRNRQNRHDNQRRSQAVIPSPLNLYGLEVSLDLSVQHLGDSFEILID